LRRSKFDRALTRPFDRGGLRPRAFDRSLALAFEETAAANGLAVEC
jgi:hypothetical protein